jgi:HSP20 family protein
MPKSNHEVALLTVRRRVRPSGRLWNPAADVYRSPDGWLVKVDLAGVRPNDLQIELFSSSLEIRGCRRDTVVRDGFTYQQMEITYSQFQKTIQFPCTIEEASLEQDYRDGFLIVRLHCK